MDILEKLTPYILMTKGYIQSYFSGTEKAENPVGDVDIVVTWVDGNDPAWQAEKSKYDGSTPGNNTCRYRDWVTFRYWFRMIEKYAPWVRNVYLVTWGHVPEWLNLNAEKLKVVKHQDFVPQEYLPTFNSSAIELNMHRIAGLSEYFVYFNDDVFLCRPAEKTDFFSNGYICFPSISTPLVCRGNMVSYHKLLSIFSELNGKNDIRKSISEHPQKWFSHKYGLGALRNTQIYKSDGIAGMHHPHMALPVRKQAFYDAWEKYPAIAQTCSNKFRSPLDVSHFLISIDEMLKGNFEPVVPEELGRCIGLEQTAEIDREFRNQNHKMICFNDSDSYTPDQVDQINKELERIFSVIFPEKSSFEK